MTDLDARLLQAHADGDRAALVTLYTRAADAAGDEDMACFYLTHAYVFALERGDDRAAGLRQRLQVAGRE